MSKALRRHNEKKKQRKRIEVAKSHGMKFEDPRQLGYFKDNHIGCSCAMCKPWKAGWVSRVKPSEMAKQVIDEESLI